MGLIPGLGRSSGGGHGNPLQYSFWRNPQTGNISGCSPQGHAESDMTKTTQQRQQHTPRGFSGAMVKDLPANAGGTRDVGSILGWEDPLKEEMATHSNILAWKISWTEKPWQAMVHGSDTIERQHTQTQGKCITSKARRRTALECVPEIHTLYMKFKVQKHSQRQHKMGKN